MSCIDTINQLRENYERKYGFAVLDLSVTEAEDKIHVSGKVLTESQKQEVFAALELAGGKPLDAEIEVLSEYGSGPQQWARVEAPLVDLKSRFVDSTLLSDRILQRIRSTQALRGEALRILLEKDGQLLVQTGDMTLGWVDGDKVARSADPLENTWRRGTFAAKDKLLEMPGAGREAVEAAEKLLGVPYVLGAKSLAAIDCSGLMQLAYKNAYNIILPRHSWDQKKLGVPVTLDAAQDGDLVFMINPQTGTKHVGMIENTNEGKNIIHACLARGGVVRERAEEALDRYTLVEVRRLIKK
jgi:hypothetical protein